MENLIGRKVLCTQSYDGVTRGKKYEIVKCNEETFTIVEDNGCEQPWSKEHLATKVHFKLITDEWIPKQGEIKVGDWVFLNDEKGVCKITDKHDLEEVNNKFTLVKNPQLIELLNKEL